MPVITFVGDKARTETANWNLCCRLSSRTQSQLFSVPIKTSRRVALAAAELYVHHNHLGTFYVSCCVVQQVCRIPTLWLTTLWCILLEVKRAWRCRSGRMSITRSDSSHLWMWVQVKPFRKLRKVHNKGKRTRVRDLIRYDLRQMHAAFSGTLPVGSSAESLGHTQVCTQSNPDACGKPIS